MAQFLFPNAYELSRIEMDYLPTLTEDDPAFDMFPIVTKDSPRIIWEQRDNFLGLMDGRAANAAANNLRLVGANRFEMDPARYSNFVQIEEARIEQMRNLGDYHEPMSLDEQVMWAQDQLLNNRLNRMRYNIWTLLSTGAVAVNSPNGETIYEETYPFQTLTPPNAWSNLASSTPLYDMRYLKILARGHSVRFDRASKAYGNMNTVINLLANANNADIGGKRRDVGATFNSLENVNEVFTANDLPNIEGYDEGYFDASGVFHTFIPANVVIVVGRRINGDPVGEFQLTRNAANADAAPGPYTFITDSTQTGIPIPRGIRVDDGFNGGIACWYPTAVIILNVGGGGSYTPGLI